ncbi:MAG: hypothetical protein MI974_26110 [Chitinophagales bacterium]|nr:hypothetical protein [Chitinophagales bacterium]
MNFRIKILDTQNPKPILREVYRLEEVITLIEKRYSTIPEISYDPIFEDGDFFFLIFGSILPHHYVEIRRVDQTSFYFSSSFNYFKFVLDEFKLKGFCDFVHFNTNSPMFYGKKYLCEKMKGVRLGVQDFKGKNLYVQTYSKDATRDIVDFIFDYIDLLDNE